MLIDFLSTRLTRLRLGVDSSGTASIDGGRVAGDAQTLTTAHVRTTALVFALSLLYVCLASVVHAQPSSASAPSATPTATPAATPATASPAVPPAATPAAPPAPAQVALLLPLSSKALGPAADALRAGFVAAANTDGKEAPTHKVVALDNDALALGLAYRAAVKEGVQAIVAGLTRDGASMTARESGLVPTLALNLPTTDLGDAPPNNYLQISLGLDAEARALAQHIRGEGRTKLIVVHTSTLVSRRVQEAFEKEWIRLGGEIPLRIPFTNDPADAERIHRVLDRFAREARGEKGPSLDRPLKPPKKPERGEKPDRSEKPERLEFAGADAIVLLADTQSARFARPYFPAGVPVFAASTALDARAGAVQNIDLDGVFFLEMPWFIQPDHSAVMTYPKPEVDLPVDYERLYALGIDAWRIINAMLKAPKNTAGKALPSLEPIDGVTGRLKLEGYQFARALTLIDMRDGRPHVMGKTD